MEMDRWFEMAFHRLNREPPNPNVLAVGKRGFVVGRGGDPADWIVLTSEPCFRFSLPFFVGKRGGSGV